MGVNENRLIDVLGHKDFISFINFYLTFRMAYPVYLFNQIKDETKMLLYDIACQMKAHLRVSSIIPSYNLIFLHFWHLFSTFI